MKWLAYLLCFLSMATSSAAESLYAVVTEDDFDDVKSVILEGIAAQGMSLSHVSDIGVMLDRTGKDLGYKQRVYGKAVAIEFCSAYYSRKMMAADPNNIRFCPFKISIYTLPKAAEQIYIVYNLPEVDVTANPWLPEFASIMQEIVAKAVE
ncbi:MAG: DUF302 domain-containing protein [Methylococcales bacterium]|jgi:hypothetical protein|nr:DUF302 domain-containing protein [Methylococcales bacterium]MBT7446119.1 DUF302 domain-containing protein [Methylococcales bacterium]